jgi:hypothetical protein
MRAFIRRRSAASAIPGATAIRLSFAEKGEISLRQTLLAVPERREAGSSRGGEDLFEEPMLVATLSRRLPPYYEATSSAAAGGGPSLPARA